MSHWSLVYLDYDPEQEPFREALCAVGNGYFVARAAAPECWADDVHYPGTYVAALYNRLHTEVAGRTVENEDLVNAPNWLPLTFRVDDGPWFHVDEVNVLDYRLDLDMRRGLLNRRIRFEDADARITQVTQRRFAHMGHRHIGGLETTILPINWSGTLDVRSALDGDIVNAGVARYRDLANVHLEPIGTWDSAPDTITLLVETTESKVDIALSARTRAYQDDAEIDVERSSHHVRGRVSQHLVFEASEGRAVTIEKIVSMFTSRDRAIAEPRLEAEKHLERTGGFQDLLRKHVLAWDHLWGRFDIHLSDGETTNAALCLHIFQLLQTVSPNSIDLDRGVPARGWHGEAYRGHVFWDELFIFPFLNLRLPQITRSLIHYRFRRLPEAVWAAHDAGYEGAMFPWQSASDGREETQRVHLNPKSGRWLPDASRLQRHVNAAIAYNIWQYFQVTTDTDFMSAFGAELFVGIARFWSSIASFNRARGRYEIQGVMGPDEYHDTYPGADEPGLDNNAYTNVMAAWVLARGLEIFEHVPGHRREELWEKLGMRREELERWEDISRRMYVPFHENGIISQFEGYEKLEEFDWERYRAEYGDIARLDRILEAKGDSTNRYKLSKQADVLMLFYLLSGEELQEIWDRLGYEWDRDLIPRNVEYYETRTSHGSTLSSIVHSWVLARLDRRRAYEFFRDALASDIEDSQSGTTKEGIHLGAMAGTVDLVQRGFMGLETRQDTLWFDPQLPEELGGLRFHMQYRKQCMDVEVKDSKMLLTLRPSEAEPINVAVRVGNEDSFFEITPGQTIEVDV